MERKMPQPAGFDFIASRLFERYQRAVLTFAEAAKELDFPTVNAAYTALSRGKFPVRVLRDGFKSSVLLTDLALFLATGAPQRQGRATQTLTSPDETPRRRPGRPRKDARPLGAAA